MSAGAVAGAIGLFAFGAAAWGLLPKLAAWHALGAATAAWAATAIIAWRVRFRALTGR